MPAAATGSVGGPAAGTVSTVAGGVGGPAKATAVALSPCSVTSAAGSVYAGAGHTVRQVSLAGELTTPAGTGAAGRLGDGGPAAKASLSNACGVAVDGSGNLVIVDIDAQRVRVVAASTGTFYGQAMTARHIYTVAGGGPGGLGDGGPATSARLHKPYAVAIDGAGNLLIADTAHQRIRVVATHTGTFYGQAMTAGDIYTVAGNGTRGFSGDGGPATSAELAYPWGVAVDGAGNPVIDDQENGRIRVVAAHTGTFYGQAMTAGDIYTVAGTGTAGFSGDGGPATHAEIHSPLGVAVDGAGNLLIADTFNQRIRVVAESTGTFYGQAMTAGDIYTVAGTGTVGYSGDGRPATQAKLNYPHGVAVDGAGNLVIADTDSRRIRVVAESSGAFYGKTMTAGDIYTVAGGGPGFAGDGRPATHATLGAPPAVTLDGAGNLVIADQGDNRVRVVAEGTGTFYGRAMAARHIYTVAGTGRAGSSGNGGPATSARLNSPSGAAVDGAGNLLIADTGNHRIRVVAARTGTFYGVAMTAGDIYSVAGTGAAGFSGDGGPATSAKLNSPPTVTVDGAGNLVIADQRNQRVRVVAARTGTFYGMAMTAGDIYTVAGTGAAGFAGDGGPATSAKLNSPYGAALDGAGNLLIADQGNQRVRVVAAHTGTFYGQAMTAGDIYSVAGTGTVGFSGDGGPATSAELNSPAAVTPDGAGNLLIADTSNNRIRVVAASTGSFYGQAMTAGDIYTVAGNGRGGFAGDGHLATRAQFSRPYGVAVDGAGDLFIADTGNNRIREVTG
jgi:hypothetical protein